MAAVPYIKCHSLFHCHEEVSVFSRESAARGVWAAFGGGLLLLHSQSAPPPPPSLCFPSPQTTGLPVIDSPFIFPLVSWCSIRPLPSPGCGPGSVPKPLRSIARRRLLHPCGWKAAGYTCVRCVLGLVTYPPSVWLSLYLMLHPPTLGSLKAPESPFGRGLWPCSNPVALWRIL